MPSLAEEFALPETAAPAPRANLIDEFEPPEPRHTEDLAREAGHRAIEWNRAWNDADTPAEGVALVRKWVGDKAGDAFAENASKFWEDANTPLVTLPRLSTPSEANTPTSMQPMHKAASVLAGTYNAVAGAAEGLVTPLNIGTLGTFGALTKAAQGVGKAAKAAQWALAALKVGFGAEMAEAAGGQAGKASVELADPSKSLQEKTEAAVSPVVTAGLAIISAASGGKDVAELTTPKAQPTGPTVTERVIEGEEVKVESALEKTREAVRAAKEVPAEAPPEPTPAVAPAETGEIQYTIQRPQEFEGRTIPGYTQIERRSNAGRGEPLVDAEREPHKALSDQAIDAGIPTGQYTESQLREFLASKQAPTPAVNVAAEFTAPPVSETVSGPPPEATPQGGATPEPLEARTTSIKNEIVDQERAARGLPPAMQEAAREFPEVWDEAMKRFQQNPEAGDTLVSDLKRKPRALDDIEDAMLLRHQIEVQNEFAEVSKRIQEGRGTPDELAADRQTQTQLANDLLDVYNVGKAAGTETARGLNARKMLADENYTLGQMVTLRRALRNGAELAPEELAQTEKLQAKIDELQTEFDEYRARASELLMKDEPATPAKKSVGGRTLAALSTQAQAARARIRARLSSGRVSAGLDPADLADYAIIGADYIARGIAKTAEWGEAMVKEFGEKIRPHLEAIRAKADETVGEVQKTRTEASKKRTAKRIEDLERRIKEGDFSKRTRQPLPDDPELRKLQAQLEAAKDEFTDLMEKDKFEQLSATGKAVKRATALYDLQRTIQTTGELSFIGRQGAFAAASSPILTAKAIPNAIRALFSDPIEARALDLEVFNHPDYAAARRAGVHLVREGERLSRMDEVIGAKLIERVWGLRHFGQSARVFLNKLRFDLWRDMRNSIDNPTPAQDKQFAMMTNEVTGRGGLGRFEALAVPTGRFLYAPRFMVSRFQTALGHSMWGGDAVTRKVIAKRYARALVGAGAYYTAMSLILGDDKKKVELNWHPTSADFGKVKIGDTRLDPLGGISQTIRFGARMGAALAKEKVLTTRGQERAITPVDEALRFGRTKLAPIPGSLVDLYKGTDLAGRPVTLAGEAVDFIRPLTYQDIQQALENSEDLSDEMVFALMAMLGQGLQTYDANERAKRPLKPNPKKPITVDDIRRP